LEEVERLSVTSAESLDMKEPPVVDEELNCALAVLSDVVLD